MIIDVSNNKYRYCPCKFYNSSINILYSNPFIDLVLYRSSILDLNRQAGIPHRMDDSSSNMYGLNDNNNSNNNHNNNNNNINGNNKENSFEFCLCYIHSNSDSNNSNNKNNKNNNDNKNDNANIIDHNNNFGSDALNDEENEIVFWDKIFTLIQELLDVVFI